MVRHFPLPLAGLLLSLIAVVSTPARAQWTENGVPVTAAPGHQTGAAMALDGEGGVFIAWLDENPPTSVLLQRIGPDGRAVAGWPEGGLSIGAARIGPPLLAGDGAGGVYLAWYGGEPIAPLTLLQRVSGSGSIVSGWPDGGMPLPFVMGSPYPGAAMRDGAGGLFILWPYRFWYTDPHGRQYWRTDWYLQRLTASGAIAPGWPADGRWVVLNLESTPAMASDGHDGIIMGFTAFAPPPFYGSGGIVKRLDGAGGTIYTASVDCGNSETYYYQGLQMYPDGDGGAIVAFEEYSRIGTFIQRTLQRFDPTGQIVSTWAPSCQPFFSETFLNPTMPVAAGDGGTGVFMVWQDTRSSTDADLFAIRLNADGVPSPGWSLAGDQACAAPGVQGTGVQMIPDGAGGAVLVWPDSRNAALSGMDIFAQRLGPDGPSVPGWPPAGLPVCTAAGTQQGVLLAPDGTGGAFVCWQDHRSGSADIYLHRLAADGPVPVQVSLVGARVDADGVRVEWHLGGSFAGSVFVQRREVEGDWFRQGSASPDGIGRIHHEDQGVRPGNRYGYRLELQDGSDVTFAGDVWVDVPSVGFRLGSPTPNPSARDWTVSLSLLGGARATLEVLDVLGRVVMIEEVGSLGAGRHQVPMNVRAPLPAGVYTLRLTEAGRTATARGVIVR